MGDSDDFDSVAWCYDRMPVPTHPRRLAPRFAGLQGNVLDLGGGTGRFTVRIFDPRTMRIVVVDPARKMLQKGRKKKRPVDGVQGVGQRLPFADASFAGVVMTEAFHHFTPHQSGVLEEVARVLADDGLLVIEEPDPTRIIGRLMYWGERLQGMSSVFYPPEKLVALLKRSFGTVETETTGWFTYLAQAKDPIR